MISIDEMQDMLDELAEELPSVFYEELNGGILLLPQMKLSEYARSHDLYILGEYVRDRVMGRYIVIYYGSFERVYGHLREDAFKDELRKTLRHEFRHHLEYLAGEDDLEKEDDRDLRDYLKD
ncbi:MAG: metallopeptidase family protein [Clostridiales Family XIII bacterium]|jgi:hypothetical protein|nr:metallopeptidase family protein [Clostridiales Family XIII bacterium]